jgi:tRNA pseudouridine38-40 synthase
MNYKVIVSYDGTSFHGWAKQKDVRTVQQTIEELLSKIFDKKINIEGSGRTDAYVHAIEQVFSFKVKDSSFKPQKLLNILNTIKPSDIQFRSIKLVNDKFHARYLAKYKIYHYVINLHKENVFENNYIHNYKHKVDLKLMKKCARLFVGKHDFKSFSRSELTNTTRTIRYIKFKKQNNKLTISICGDGFLRNMVRMIVGSLFDINEGIKQLSDITKLLTHPLKGSAISKAPARGLYLLKVIY